MEKKLRLISLVVLLFVFVLAVVLLTTSNQYDREIKATLATIPVNTINIAIITDMHHDLTYKVDPINDLGGVLSRLFSSGKITALWNLGDLINGHNSTKDQAEKLLLDVVNMEKAVTADYHNIEGNHDNNIQSTWEGSGGLPETEILSNDELNMILENTGTDQVEYHSILRATDYYVDFDTLRIVCITAEYTTFQPETAEWLRTEALETDKEVLVLAHCPTRPEWGFRNDIENGDLIEEELKKFIDSGGTVVAYIHGHDHGDMISDAGDWKEVAIGCSRFHVPSSNGTPGMTFWERKEEDESKLLFDIVCIDQKERTIRFIRFGTGEDRAVKY